MFRINFTVLLICCIVSLSQAQDSTKKVVPVPVKTAPVNTNPKNKTYKYHRYHAKADSAAVKTDARQTTVAMSDTSAPAPILTDKSLNGQYQYLLTKVYHYQQPLISALWKSVLDTVSANHLKLKAAQSKLTIQSKTIDSLNADVTNKEENLSASNARIGGVTVLGILLSKTTYNIIVWGLVALFAITAIVVIIRTARDRREAREKTQLYTELEEEFKAYKIKAGDKEKKLARELQTERNKLDELLGRG